MVIKTNILKDKCTKILMAVDNNEFSLISETLELFSEDRVLKLNVTNRQYFVSINIPIEEDINFHATINANLFLKLISQSTCEDIELQVDSNYLKIKGNGNYKIPLIFEEDHLLSLPKIELKNITLDFYIKNEVLQSILLYNSKQLNTGIVVKPCQRYFYIDEKGAITFTSGACVNNFNLDFPVKMLLNNKIVKLFKLFKQDDVHFYMAQDSLSEDIIQTKVQFITDEISITSILYSDFTLLNSVPAKNIRDLAQKVQPYNIVIYKDLFIQSINRVILFNRGYGNKDQQKPFGKVSFYKDCFTISDENSNSFESIAYKNSIITESTDILYTTILDLSELKLVLEGCNEQFINIGFGNHSAITITRTNIVNIIPECNEE